jgi:hypothetical protein
MEAVRRAGYAQDVGTTIGGAQLGQGSLRNRVCWCGSGKKFKDCHLRLQEERAVSPWDAEAMVRDAYGAEYCSAPEPWRKDCSAGIVRAHTIPRSASLGAIARDGHVYMFVPSMQNFVKGDGRLEPQLLGVKRASTFTGFCGDHDCSIFAPLETRRFDSQDREQLFLLGYRAFARERFTKQAQLESLDAQRAARKGRKPLDQLRLQMMIDGQEIGIKAALADQEATRAIMDRMLLTGQFEDVRAYVIQFAAAPPVMCSGCVCPEQDFFGNVLQDLGDLDRVAEPINANAFFDGNCGYFVLSWLAQHDGTCRPLAESLASIDDTGVTAALLRLMFEFFENLCISPDWWEGLGDDRRKVLVDRMMLSVSSFAERGEHCLAPDGLEIPPWAITSRAWVG